MTTMIIIIIITYFFFIFVYGASDNDTSVPTQEKTNKGNDKEEEKSDDRPWEDRYATTTCYPSQDRIDMYQAHNTLKMGNFIDYSGPNKILYHYAIMMLFGHEFKIAYVSSYDDFDEGACIEEDLPFSFDIRDVAKIIMVSEDPITYMSICTEHEGKESSFDFAFGGGRDGRSFAEGVRDRIWKLKEVTASMHFN